MTTGAIPMTGGREMTEAPTGDEAAVLAYWHRAGYEAAVAATDRFAATVRRLDDAQLRTLVPGLSWTALEVVAHVASVYQRYTVNRRRAATPAEVAEHNAEDLLALGATSCDDASALVEDMVVQLATFAGVIDHVEPDRRFPFHGGQEVTLAGGWGNLLGELLAHGDDIARATGSRWTLDAADLEPVWRFGAPILGGWLTDAGRQATDRWRLDYGFSTGPVLLTFTGGGFEVGLDDGAPVEHTIAADPVETTLAVPYGRRRITDPTLALLADRFVSL